MSQAKLVDPSDVSPPTWEQRPLVHLNTRLIIHSLIGSSRPLIGVGYDDLEADRAGVEMFLVVVLSREEMTFSSFKRCMNS